MPSWGPTGPVKTALTTLYERVEALEGASGSASAAPIVFTECNTEADVLAAIALGHVAVLPQGGFIGGLYAIDIPLGTYVNGNSLKFFNTDLTPTILNVSPYYTVSYDGNELFRIEGQESYSMVYDSNMTVKWLIVPGIVANGSGGTLGTGASYSDYLYYDPVTDSWEVSTDGKIHIGSDAGLSGQGDGSVAIGDLVCSGAPQGNGSVAIGNSVCSMGTQGDSSVAIGDLTCLLGQGMSSVAIGDAVCGTTGQGDSCVAIGNGICSFVGATGQQNNTVIISGDATFFGNGILTPPGPISVTGGIFLAPMAGATASGVTGSKAVYYNPSTGELFYDL